MKKINKITIFSAILLLLLFVTLNFIFSNSFESSSKSSEKSSRVLEIVEPVLELIVGENNVTTKLVRKLAHFCEFFVLGVELVVVCMLHGIKKIHAALIGLLAAATDEIIQIFSNRGAQISDVILDFSAVLFSILVIFVCQKLYEKIKKSRT